MNQLAPQTNILTPPAAADEMFTNAAAAVARLTKLYDAGVKFLAQHFADSLMGTPPDQRIRAFYPEVRITTTSYAQIDSRLAFGHVNTQGTYFATITRPDLFANYLEQQIGLLLRNHGVPVSVGFSDTPIPVHFAVAANSGVLVPPKAP